MKEFTCEEIKEVVFQLMNEKCLNCKVFVAGGILPWIISSNDSNRKHSDIDIVVAKENMPLIRAYLKNKGLYNIKYDSIHLDFNTDYADFGIEAFINDIPVNFAPFEYQGNDIIQKNFSVAELSGLDALVQVTMKGIKVDDYVTFMNLANGLCIGMYTLEMVKSAKEISNRDKDIYDLKEIEKIGFDAARYNRVKPVVQNMSIDFIPGNPVE
ncbi:MAG: hypothetical protein AB2417_14390 [Clostridiaceae bacterium]